MPPLDEFKREVVTYLPGLLALFDIAGAKGRNFHLGHQVVDRDIDELDRQLQMSAGVAGLAKRVGGMSGWPFTKPSPLNRSQRY